MGKFQDGLDKEREAVERTVSTALVACVHEYIYHVESLIEEAGKEFEEATTLQDYLILVKKWFEKKEKTK